MIVTTCVDIRYQVFAPLLAWSAQRLWGCRTVVFSTDGIHPKIKEVMAGVSGAEFVSGVSLGRKIAPSVLRFLLPLSTLDITKGEEYYLIVDADLLLTDLGLMEWYTQQMRKTGMPYAGHPGARHKPERPGITGKSGWTGDWQRVTGGFVLVTPQWFKATEKARNYFAEESRMPDFREADEVTLARIITHSGLSLPPKGFPKVYRGIHLGDFRLEMMHRYQNTVRMQTLLPEPTVAYYRKFRNDPQWKSMLTSLLSISPRDIGLTEGHWLGWTMARLDEYANTGRVVR